MRVGIFYFSPNSGLNRNAVLDADGNLAGFVRCEVIETAGDDYGLDEATPDEDEAVMNSHPLEWSDFSDE